MLKTLLKSAAAPLVLLAVTGTSALAAPPAVTPVMLLANPATGGSDAASGEAAIMEMFSKLFDPGEQAPIDAAQLALGQTTAARLLPEGAYGRMMEQMMGQFIKPILAMEKSMSGMQIAGKTGIDAAAAEALTEQQRDAVLAILDPGREARNDGMMAVLKPLMVEAGKALEAPMREGWPGPMPASSAPRSLPTSTAFSPPLAARRLPPKVLRSRRTQRCCRQHSRQCP